MKSPLLLVLALSFYCSVHFSNAFAAGKVTEVDFDSVKPHRENFDEKTVQIEGRVKNLKVITEAGTKFATFFLTDPTNPETSVSVKVNLSKKKTVINTFTCTEGEYVTVQGRFKPWGTASYLGKIEIRDPYEFKCSEKAVGHRPRPINVAKKKGATSPSVESPDSTVPQPVLLTTNHDGANQITDPRGNPIHEAGASLAPGSTIKTGAHSTVQLKYPDGSKLAVGPNSQVTTDPGSQAVQSVSMKLGRVHALIFKQKKEQLHFKIRTKSATMGVRGTEFFVDANPEGKSTTRVVEGTVVVARNDAELSTPQARSIFHDQMVDVENGQISETKTFDSAAYLAQLKTEQPEILAFADAQGTQTAVASAATSAAIAASTPAAIPAAIPAAATTAATATSPTPAPVEHASQARAADHPQWLLFRLSALRYTQSGGDTATYSGMLSWNPEIPLSASWSFGLDLGYGSQYSTLESAAVLAYQFSPEVALEIKGGAQTWLSPSSVTGAMGGLALRFGLCENCFIRSIIVGDDLLSIQSATINVLRLGIGIRL